MKPLCLKFSAFGPYTKEQTIDFETLSKAGLFLICGKTGAGKTVILDAMTYALYGKASGDLRGDLKQMRCQNAGPEDKTFTEFSFEAQGRVYRFRRSLRNIKKRDGSIDYNMEYGLAVQNHDGIFEPLYANPKGKELEQKAEELMGLTYHQFRQVVILPQGQFEQLLVANSAEKEEILVSLFHAEKWQKTAEYIYKRALDEKRRLDCEKEEMERILKTYQAEEIDQFQAVRSAMKDKLKEIQIELQKAEEVKSQAFEDLETYQGIENQYCELEKKQEAFAALLKEQDEIGCCRELLENCRCAREVRPYYETFLKQEAQTEKRQTEYKMLSKRCKTAKEHMEETKRLWEDIQKQMPENEEALSRIRQYESLISVYRERREAEAGKNKAEFELVGAQKEEASRKIEYQTAQEACKNTQRKHAALCKQYALLYEVYYDNIRGVFAGQLEEGKPCPICGSIEHPDIYKGKEPYKEITRGEIDQTRQKMDQEQENVHACGKQEDICRKEYEKSRENTEEKKKEYQRLEVQYEQLCARLLPGIDTLECLMENIGLFKKQTEEFHKTLEDSKAFCDAAQTAYHTAQTASEMAEAEYENQRKLHHEAEKRLNDMLIKTGIASRQALEQSILEETKQNDIENRVSQYETQLAALKAAIQTCRDGIGETPRANLKIYQEAYREKEAQVIALSNAFALTQQQLKEADKAYKGLKSRLKKYEKDNQANAENLIFAKHIRGDYGIGLQRYILGVMLSKVTEEANRLLMNVHDGRYQLFRSMEGTKGSRKTGLDLEVFDSMSGGRRGVASLSGGEKFLVALALSLGLSTVVQAQSGGVRLGAIFIDEGFGSLDHSSIDDAMAVLSDMNRSNGLVGIISHVDILKENIPVKVMVDKRRDGSSLRVVG